MKPHATLGLQIYVIYQVFTLCLGMLQNNEVCMLRDYFPNNGMQLFKYIYGHCFSEKTEPIVVVIQKNHQNDCFLQFQEVVLIGIEETETANKYVIDNKKYTLNSSNTMFKPYPAKRFALVEVDLALFKTALFKLKSSIWWNASGFFIVEIIRNENNCNDVIEYLNTAWEFNILSVILICQSEDSNVYVYTFNPYNPYAPLAWKGVDRYEYGSGHMTLFRRIFYFNDTTSSCTQLDFDRTRILVDHTIKVSYLKRFVKSDTIVELNNTRFGFAANTLDIVWKFLNATISIELVDGDNGSLDDNGYASKTLANVLGGTYDMNAIMDAQREIWRYELNLFMTSSVCYVTGKEYVTYSQHMMSIINSEFMLVVTGSITVILLILTCVFKMSFGEVSLDFVRALVGTSMLRKTETCLDKSICILLAYLFMNLSFFFQSELSSLLSSSQVRNINIESSDDLIANGFKIYVSDYDKQYFRGTAVYHQFFNTTNLKPFLGLMSRDKRIAFAGDCSYVQCSLFDNDTIRISKDRTLHKYFVVTHKEDFPLQRRAKQVYHRLFEQGIAKYLFDAMMFRHCPAQPKSFDKDIFRMISSEDIKFALYFYYVGILCAGVSFLLENIANYVYK